MVKNLPFILSILVLMAPLCWTQTYPTNPIRTQTVQKLCAPFADRYQIITQAEKAQTQQYHAAMKSGFSFTGTELFGSIIDKFGEAMSSAGASTDMMSMLPTLAAAAPVALQSVLVEYPTLPQQYGLFVGPFVLCLFILCFTCLCACCCCCCPAGCPPCGCCRKPMGQPYTKCQLIWPGIVLLLSLGLILAAGAIGLSKSADIQNTVQGVGCSISIAIDDLLNGNVTKSQKIFVGAQTLSNKVGLIISALNNEILPQFGNISPAISNANTNMATAKADIDAIPAGTTGRMSPFDYSMPFNGTAAANNLPSTFPTDLGSTNNPADYQTPICRAFNGLQLIQDNLNAVQTASSSVVSDISGGGFNTSLNSAKDAIKNVTGGIKSADEMFYSMFSQVTPHMSTATTAATGVYAGLIAISCVGMLATLLLLICNFYKCRFLLYFTCCILILVGIICLFLAIIISALLPFLYFTCDFTTTTFSSAAGFNNNIGSLVPSAYSNYTTMITNCLPGQSGDFLQATLLGAAGPSLANLQNSLGNLTAFNAAAINAQIDNLWNPVKNMVDDTYQGRRIDFVSADEEASLNKIANSVNTYPECTGNTNFVRDSWIPVAPGAAITCKGGRTNNAACANIGQIQSPGASSCYGCMSARLFFKTFGATLTTDLDTRYASCSSNFISHMNAMNTRFYGVKQLKIAPVVARKNTAQTSVDAYKTSINNIGAVFTSINTQLATTVSSITDTRYGLIAGLNCAIFGQDFLLINNVACGKGFKLLFFIRAAFGIAGFGVLFSMYCASCTGARHFKQQQAKSKAKLDKDNNKIDETLQDLQQKNNPRQNINNSIQEGSRSNRNMQPNNMPKQSNNFINEKDYATRYQGNQQPYY